jgi:hypothetical protein
MFVECQLVRGLCFVAGLTVDYLKLYLRKRCVASIYSTHKSSRLNKIGRDFPLAHDHSSSASTRAACASPAVVASSMVAAHVDQAAGPVRPRYTSRYWRNDTYPTASDLYVSSWPLCGVVWP